MRQQTDRMERFPGWPVCHVSNLCAGSDNRRLVVGLGWCMKWHDDVRWLDDDSRHCLVSVVFFDRIVLFRPPIRSLIIAPYNTTSFPPIHIHHHEVLYYSRSRFFPVFDTCLCSSATPTSFIYNSPRQWFVWQRRWRQQEGNVPSTSLRSSTQIVGRRIGWRCWIRVR